jgi:hypothetical protein
MRPSSMLLAGLALVVCLGPTQAAPSGVDAGTYRKYSCPQLLEEGRRVSARAAAIGHDVADARASNTAFAEDSVVIPGVLTSPVPASGEMAILKQKLAAIEDATVQSQCQIEFRNAPQ